MLCARFLELVFEFLYIVIISVLTVIARPLKQITFYEAILQQMKYLFFAILAKELFMFVGMVKHECKNESLFEA
jgi:hypothetical protein